MNVKPFNGYLLTSGNEDIVSLPYDVYSDNEAKNILIENNYSFIGIEKSELFVKDDIDFKTACIISKNRFYNLVSDKKYKNVSSKFFIYKQVYDSKVNLGIVCECDINEYGSRKILKHENTTDTKLNERILHIDTTNLQTGMIFLVSKKNNVLIDLINSCENSKPIINVQYDNVKHIIYVIDDKFNEVITNEFSKIKNLYIADGHHRIEAEYSVYKRRKGVSKYFMATIFFENSVNIYEYNRVIKNIKENTTKEVIEKISDLGSLNIIENPRYSRKKGEFIIYFDDIWYSLEIKNHSSSILDSLDTSWLQNNIIYPIFGIKDPKNSIQIEFIGGIKGYDAIKNICDHSNGIGFILYPTNIKDLFSVSDKNKLMPPKSTWFEPKLLSGIFVKEIQ